MRQIIFLSTLFLFLSQMQSFAQGCVAIRQYSSCSGNNLGSNFLSKGDWQFGMNYRYYKSFRHFRGTHEEPDRVANGTEVINHANALDFSISYGLGKRFFANMNLPFVLYSRSSLYEHGRTQRNTTFSRGLADMRIGAGYWLIPESKYDKGNIAIGAGIKLPTGNYNATDIFYNVGVNGTPQVRPVDQSIQPGDGGFGIAIDAQLYQQITRKLTVYASGFYLFNPRDTNVVRTFRETLSPLLVNEAYSSVPDQFSIRGGLNFAAFNGVGISFGVLYEGVPVEDLVGESNGFRRPGSVVSLDPGISFVRNNCTLNLSVPFALKRNRPQSLTDLETEQLTGMPRAGDAAFADYLINFGFSYRFACNKSEESNMTPHWEDLKKN